MVLTNAERQARYQQKLRQTAYENQLFHRQIEELERRLNETRRAVRLPEIQLPKSAYGANGGSQMSGKLEGDSKTVLETVQAIFGSVIPDASCELQDYEHRIGCGALDRWGNIQEVIFLRRGLSEADVEREALILSAKVQGSESFAVVPEDSQQDEDDLADQERKERERNASRNSTTGY